MPDTRFDLAVKVIIQANDLLEDEPYTYVYPKVKRAYLALKAFLDGYEENQKLSLVE